jgi:hypothetical protein
LSLGEELAQRLEDFGAPDAAERLRQYGTIHLEDKPVVREVLGRWQRSVGSEQSAELTELDRRLAQDIDVSWPSMVSTPQV